MKNYIALGVGIVVLLVAVFVGYKFTGQKKSINKNNNSEVIQNMVTVTGEVSRNFEGASVLGYSFDIPEYATSTVSESGDLIKIADATSTRTTVYFTYEGGRGLSPLEYISEIIAPHVSVIDETGTTTMGNYEWQLAETAGSHWHITSLKNGEWIVAIESKKVWSNEADKLVNSFKAE